MSRSCHSYFRKNKNWSKFSYQLKTTHFNNKEDINKMERLTWDQYFCKIAKVTSERSPCERLQVGCVLVKNNRIVAQGYNGFLPNCPHNSIVIDNG